MSFAEILNKAVDEAIDMNVRTSGADAHHLSIFRRVCLDQPSIEDVFTHLTIIRGVDEEAMIRGLIDAAMKSYLGHAIAPEGACDVDVKIKTWLDAEASGVNQPACIEPESAPVADPSNSDTPDATVWNAEVPEGLDQDAEISEAPPVKLLELSGRVLVSDVKAMTPFIKEDRAYEFTMRSKPVSGTIIVHPGGKVTLLEGARIARHFPPSAEEKSKALLEDHETFRAFLTMNDADTFLLSSDIEMGSIRRAVNFIGGFISAGSARVTALGAPVEKEGETPDSAAMPVARLVPAVTPQMDFLPGINGGCQEDVSEDTQSEFLPENKSDTRKYARIRVALLKQLMSDGGTDGVNRWKNVKGDLIVWSQSTGNPNRKTEYNITQPRLGDLKAAWGNGGSAKFLLINQKRGCYVAIEDHDIQLLTRDATGDPVKLQMENIENEPDHVNIGMCKSDVWQKFRLRPLPSVR